MTPDEIPESIEAQVERIRRTSGGLTAYHLDEQVAVALARRDVAAAHGQAAVAAAWHDALLALADVRRMRADAAREIEDLTSPVRVLRPLTPEELAESEWDDDDTPAEPPC
jgi:hypothetical protein